MRTAGPAPNVLRQIDELIELSRRFGANPEFARGGGGNSSIKVDGVLYIKPSGVSLATLAADELIALEVEPFLDLLGNRRGATPELADGPAAVGAGSEAGAEGAPVGGTDEVMRVALAARLGPLDQRRPSVETLFHVLLPERFVLHTHPTTINFVTCANRGAELSEALFGDRVLWVPYTTPGLPLARAIRDARCALEERIGGPAPRAILLQNHGLIVGGNSATEIVETSEWLLDVVRGAIAGQPEFNWGETRRAEPAAARKTLLAIAPALRALLATSDRLKVVAFDDSANAVGMAGSALGHDLAGGGPLTPDQIVYAGSWPLVLESVAPSGVDGADVEPEDIVAHLPSALAAYSNAHGALPAIVVVPGLGLFTAGDTYQQADMIRQVYLDAIEVSIGAHQLGGVRPLAADERTFIERWEAEQYRRRVSSGAALSGRARGLVAIVTGAAQGFGLAFARDLVAQGAHVVLADINAGQAVAEARTLVERYGQGRAVGVALDVTEDASVMACVEEVVRRYGGLDLLVSNAGVLRAGGVTTQPIQEFDAVTRVNYRGYFLCVRHVAPILARQHRVRPEYWGDIIEINSKSGLAGSSRNSAYAGSKFGGIGLTQSFALELIGDGIKVNAICPGNFFDGPLWSDPQNGLFVQYLREGKVQGAATVEDVRRFYEAKVPMGRGCTPADVLEALYYVVAQHYETGQAIPVTGGQVMLS